MCLSKIHENDQSCTVFSRVQEFRVLSFAQGLFSQAESAGELCNIWTHKKRLSPNTINGQFLQDTLTVAADLNFLSETLAGYFQSLLLVVRVLTFTSLCRLGKKGPFILIKKAFDGDSNRAQHKHYMHAYMSSLLNSQYCLLEPLNDI